MKRSDQLLAGFSQAVINPNHPVELGGYGYFLGRVSTGVLDDLYTSALFLKLKNTKLLFISNDLIGLSSEFCLKLAKKISQKTKIPQKNIIIGCTHTHSGPATINLTGCGQVDQKYLKSLEKKISQNAIKATINLQAVEMKMKTLDVNDWGWKRSESQNQKVVQKITLILFESCQEKVLICHLAIHPEILKNTNTKISKDLVNCFHLLARQLDYQGLLFFNGTAADILPLCTKKKLATLSTSDGFITPKQFRSEIDQLNENLLRRFHQKQWQKIKPDKIKVSCAKIDLEFDIPPYFRDKEKMRTYYENCFWDKIDINKGLIKTIPDKKNAKVISKQKRIKGIQKLMKKWLTLLSNQVRTKSLKKNQKIEIRAIKLGLFSLLAIPLEIPNKFLKDLQPQFPELIIFGYTNGSEGYLPYGSNQNGYETKRGPLLYHLFPYKKESGEKVLKAVKKLL